MSFFSHLSRRFSEVGAAGLLSGAALAGMMTLGVKAVAFLKELLVAYRFGTSDELDAYLVALLVPALFAMAAGEGLRDGTIPVYSEERRRRPEDADAVFSNVIWVAVGILLAFSMVALLLGGPLMDLLGHGFSPEKRARSVALFHLLLPYVIFLGVANLLKGFLQSHRRFFLSASLPALLPMGTLLLLLVLPGTPTGAWLSLGSGVGALAMVAGLFIAARAARGRWLLRAPGWDAATRTALRGALPLMAGVGLVEGFHFIDFTMAAHLPAGSVATLSYGERVCQVFTVAGMAMVQAVYPHLSDLAAAMDWEGFRSTLRRYVLLLGGLCLPLVAVLSLGAGPLVRLIFERGEFTPEDSDRVAAVMRFAALQVPAGILMALGARAVMSLHANRFVMLASLAGLGGNVVLNLVFMRLLGVPGIALSTALVNGLIALLLLIVANRRAKRLASGR